MTSCSGARFILACTISFSFLFNAQVRGGDVEVAWNASSDDRVIGYKLYYGLESRTYTASVDAGTEVAATVAGLTPGLVYYLAVTAYDDEGFETDYSAEVTSRIPTRPWIVTPASAQTNIAGAPATLAITAGGDPPLSYQWFNGQAPIPGATTSLLSWPEIQDGNAGSYTVVVSNPAGSVTSSVISLRVIDPPTITRDFWSEQVIATAAASFESGAAGTAPLSLQWYHGTTPVAGATNSTLAWASVAAANAGNYWLRVTNIAGAVTSAVATLTVLPTNTIATAAGVYNGLFFQVNSDGTPDVTEATAGMLGNCVVAGNGVFSARVYLGGTSYPLAGVFDIYGNASATISRASMGLSNLAVVLTLGFDSGTARYGEIYGAISSMTAGNNFWSASLLADPETNAFPQLAAVNLTLSPGSAANSPITSGAAIGSVLNSVLTLTGVLPDTAIMTQTVPISRHGTIPLYANLYNNGGLVEGWLTLSGGVATGALTWIRPSGVLLPLGYPQGFNTVIQVSGGTYNH